MTVGIKDYNSDAVAIIQQERGYLPVTSGKTFTLAELADKHYRFTYDLTQGDALLVFPETLPDGYQITGVVEYHTSNALRVRIGDGLTFPISSLKGETAANGELFSDIPGEWTIRREGASWKQFRRILFPQHALTITGSVDASDPLSLAITTDKATSGFAPYSAYTITMDFLHPNQNGRQVIISGDDLAVAPTTTVAGVSGTMGSITIDSATADLYGDINITLSVTDAAANTTTVTL